MNMKMYHFNNSNKDIFFTAYETNISNTYELTGKFTKKLDGVECYDFTHIFHHSDGLFYACHPKTKQCDLNTCLGSYDFGVKLASNGMACLYKIIGKPKVIIGRNSKPWITVETDPPSNGFPVSSENIQALGIQNQISAIDADIQDEFSEEPSQDSPSSKATKPAFRHK